MRTWIYNQWWEFRIWLAQRLVHVAHKVDEGVGVDIYRGRECEQICLDIWHGHLTIEEARSKIYTAQY